MGRRAVPVTALSYQQPRGLFAPNARGRDTLLAVPVTNIRLEALVAFAVCEGGTIVRHDGVQWHMMCSGVTVDLNGVSGSSAGEVFALGDGGTILRYTH